jgi:putative ubiquitin-RnfH superfamily antitoxin RatB of RatAB toxin-antitoxin module
MRVEVVHARADVQRRYAVTLPAAATVREAIEASGVLREFPDIDLERQRVGVFGRIVALDRPLEEGERVEIYRPLTADPKEARRRRARGA